MKRVLVVDDKAENVYYLKALLEGHGFEVAEASHGEAALASAHEHTPDLVISDLLMPVMDGYTLLRAWKAHDVLKQVPFIVYTATYTEPEDEALARQLGADAFIVKPAEPEALLTRIGQVLEQLTAPSSTGPRDPVGDEGEHLQAYNQVLVRKLEKKMHELEQSNLALRADLEERTRVKEALERSSALVRMAGRTARLGGWSYLPAEGSMVWSDESCAIYDLPKGRTPTLDEAARFCLPDDQGAFRAAIEDCAREGRAFDQEFQVITPAGRQAWIRLIGEPVHDALGDVVRVQGAIQDISDRKHLEQRVLRATRMESIATLTGGIAHDLNNVLAPIVLAVELLKVQVSDDEALETLLTVESCARRGTDMVKQVLSFARGVAGAPTEVDLGRIVGDLRRLVRDSFPETVAVRSDLPEGLWSIEGDPTQIHQVLLNLFVNARDAMPEGGRLTVSAENVTIDEHYAAMGGQAVPGPHVRISVSDTGVGMSADVVEKIFDPLYTTKAEGVGTGLGLSTVATIVHNHGGFVNVYSEEGSGTTFRIHLPAAPDDSRPPPVRSKPEALQGAGELILVADDEAAVRGIAQQTLEAYGYRGLTAADGTEALDLYRRHKDEVAVVLTDMVMPNMDGHAMIAELRALNPDVVIIATSGLGADGGVERASRSGVTRLLNKPYTAEDLLRAVGSALEEGRG